MLYLCLEPAPEFESNSVGFYPISYSWDICHSQWYLLEQFRSTIFNKKEKKMKIAFKLLIVAVVVIGVFTVVSCSRKAKTPSLGEETGTAEKAGTTLDRAAEKTGEALKTAAEKTSDAAKSGAEKAKDATSRAVKKAGEVIERAGESLDKTGEDMQDK